MATRLPNHQIFEGILNKLLEERCVQKNVQSSLKGGQAICDAFLLPPRPLQHFNILRCHQRGGPRSCALFCLPFPCFAVLFSLEICQATYYPFLSPLCTLFPHEIPQFSLNISLKSHAVKRVPLPSAPRPLPHLSPPPIPTLSPDPNRCLTIRRKIWERRWSPRPTSPDPWTR